VRYIKPPKLLTNEFYPHHIAQSRIGALRDAADAAGDWTDTARAAFDELLR
jgi:hypothetical protein